MKSLSRLLRLIFGTLVSLMLIGALVMFGLYMTLEHQLPDVSGLKDIQLQVPLQIFSRNGDLIAEFGDKRRTPIPFSEIPKPFIDAVLATEDQRFFEHSGVDPIGLIRAASNLIMKGTKSQGGSTITMQVARNFFLTSKKTYTRKIKEILLALKIDQELSKEKILDLYCNKIYLGNGAYGVAAAAQVYYGKPIGALTLAQYAMIAGLPKAPSALNPIANPSAALKRRNHVLERMLIHGYINQDIYKKAVAEPLTAKYHGFPIKLRAPYVAEMVRKELMDHFGPQIYTNGWKVYTTIDSKMQRTASYAVKANLLRYSYKHGYRKPTINFLKTIGNNEGDWLLELGKIPVIAKQYPAVVNDVDPGAIHALMANGDYITIKWRGFSWAKPHINNKYVGAAPKSARSVVKVGDLIRIQKIYNKKTKKSFWALSQLPKVQGAMVALNPHDGSLLAMVGGFDFKQTKFNRAIQAERQAGSSIKPFLYSAALKRGFTMASIINDAPVVFHIPGNDKVWRPENASKRFYGPTRLRIGLIRSRNLVSVRLLNRVGLRYATNVLTQFGFSPDRIPHGLSLALGSNTVTVAELASCFAVFANGGYRVTPYYINRIENTQGKIIFQVQPLVACPNYCRDRNIASQLEHTIAPRVLSPQIIYIMNTALQDVIKAGTGRRALVLKRNDLAGKTGTTNDQVDGWFSGFNADLVVTCWVGYDQPKSLHAYAAQVALPMWIDFMEPTLKNMPEHTIPRPDGLVNMRISARTGRPVRYGGIFEIFRASKVRPRSYSSYYDVDADYNPYEYGREEYDDDHLY